ncbi:MAG: helix-turn-helix domain-containing protein, partial [Solirubrobacteraceae bacterium]
NEEWDLLPGPTFVKSFLRTYAQALGLDSKAIIEEYRSNYEMPSDLDRSDFAQQPIASAARSHSRQPRLGPSRGYVLALAGVCVLIALLIYGLLSGGSHPSTPKASNHTASKQHVRRLLRKAGSGTPRTLSATLTSLKLEPSAEVYVCLIGDGRKRIPGLTLLPGTPTRTYHARRFELTLGNNAVTLIINGRAQTVPASSRAIGYSITRAGTHSLAASEQPTCA